MTFFSWHRSPPVSITNIDNLPRLRQGRIAFGQTLPEKSSGDLLIPGH
jgi:hypothetical protein